MSYGVRRGFVCSGRGGSLLAFIDLLFEQLEQSENRKAFSFQTTDCVGSDATPGHIRAAQCVAS